MDAELERLYNNVIDDNGNVKLCGREACIALMNKCESLTGIPCGDKKKGFINVEAVKQAYNQYKTDSGLT